MEREAQRDLEILTELARGEPTTQRGLARKLGIALGLANLYLKRLARKGHIKVTTLPPNRIQYLLTPKGLAEKTRLTYEYMEYSLQLYKQTRHLLREALLPLARQGKRRVAIYGVTEAAELAFLSLRELGLELVGVMDGDGRSGTFLGFPVQSATEVSLDGVDLIIVATFRPADEIVQALIRQGIPPEKIVSLRGA